MPLWVGETWTCVWCGWVNAIIRTRCRNFDCNKVRAAAPKEK
jgi:hypothetical protein